MSEENTDEVKKSDCGEEGHDCSKDENKGDECCGGGGGGCCGK